jgi:glycosidase
MACTMSLAIPSLLPAHALGQATVAPGTGKDAPAYEPPRTRDAEGRVTGPGGGRAGWWNDVVFYQVFVRSFKDSGSGPLADDGIGDIAGLIEKLDYLNDGDPKTTSDLGIGALWLMPMHPSPSYHGYDVTDYYGINAEYGTLEDFRRLVRECHKRGIKVIIDLVLNHCSDEHPMFVRAQDPKNPEHGWFIFSDRDPGWRGPWNQQVWHRLRAGPSAGRQYYGLFSRDMPDINYRNEAASAAMLDAVRFWIDPRAGKAAGAGAGVGQGGGGTDAEPIGIDGYRLDAIRHLIEDGKVQENTLDTHEWLKKFRAFYKGVRPDAFTIGEAWTSTEMASSYVGDQLDAVFEFDLSYAMVEAARTGNAKRIIDAQDKVLRFYPPGQYGRFLTNHDQTRVMTELKGDAAAARSAAHMLLLGPGIPFVYYAEELGVAGAKPDPELRLPMPWNARRNAGFTSGRPWKNPPKEFRSVNVETQSADEASLLSLYRRLIHLRNQAPALRVGDYRSVKASDPAVYAFVRSVSTPVRAGGAGGGPGTATQSVLVVMNLSARTLGRVSLELPEGVAGALGADLLDGAFRALPMPAPIERLGPHSARVIVIEPAGSAGAAPAGPVTR